MSGTSARRQILDREHMCCREVADLLPVSNMIQQSKDSSLLTIRSGRRPCLFQRELTGLSRSSLLLGSIGAHISAACQSGRTGVVSGGLVEDWLAVPNRNTPEHAPTQHAIVPPVLVCNEASRRR